MQNEKAMTDANLDAAHRCTCGQSVHGNGHEPGCPLSSWSEPVKSEPQVGTGTALATRPFVAVNISRMETLIDTALDGKAYEQECKEQMQIACRLLRDAYSALEIDRDDPRFNQGVQHVVDMPSGESDPSVMPGSAGADAVQGEVVAWRVRSAGGGYFFRYSRPTDLWPGDVAEPLYASPPPAPAWRTMESAPKDQFIFLFCPEDGSRWLAKWQSHRWHGVDDLGLTREGHSFGDPDVVTGWAVTHWQPLPTPPGAPTSHESDAK